MLYSHLSLFRSKIIVKIHNLATMLTVKTCSLVATGRSRMGLEFLKTKQNKRKNSHPYRIFFI